MKSSVTITRIRSNMEDDCISIRIHDDSSSICIVETKLSLSDFALCITGLSAIKGEITRVVSPEQAVNIGKEKVVKSLALPGLQENRYRYSNEEMRERVLAHPDLITETEKGWMLWSDGASSQQNGKEYMISVYRYVDVDVEDESDDD